MRLIIKLSQFKKMFCSFGPSEFSSRNQMLDFEIWLSILEEIMLAVMEQQELEKPEWSNFKVLFKITRLSGYKNKNDRHCFQIFWSLVKSRQSFENLTAEVKHVYRDEFEFENLIGSLLKALLVSLFSTLRLIEHKHWFYE